VYTPNGVQRVGYSPIRQSKSWDGAVLASRTLIDVARRGRGERGDDHWTERAGALVAPLLHAASLADESLGTLASRIDHRHAEDTLADLHQRYGEHHPAVSLLSGVLSTEERERSGIWSTASGLFAGMRTDAARASAREAPLDVDEFLSGPHQLHVVAPAGTGGDHTTRRGPDRRTRARHLRPPPPRSPVAARPRRTRQRRPLPRLASIVSEGGGQGVLTLACLQDLSQARSRWGASGEGFLSLFPTTVILRASGTGRRSNCFNTSRPLPRREPKRPAQPPRQTRGPEHQLGRARPRNAREHRPGRPATHSDLTPPSA